MSRQVHDALCDNGAPEDMCHECRAQAYEAFAGDLADEAWHEGDQ